MDVLATIAACMITSIALDANHSITTEPTCKTHTSILEYADNQGSKGALMACSLRELPIMVARMNKSSHDMHNPKVQVWLKAKREGKSPPFPKGIYMFKPVGCKLAVKESST